LGNQLLIKALVVLSENLQYFFPAELQRRQFTGSEHSPNFSTANGDSVFRTMRASFFSSHSHALLAVVSSSNFNRLAKDFTRFKLIKHFLRLIRGVIAAYTGMVTTN